MALKLFKRIRKKPSPAQSDMIANIRASLDRMTAVIDEMIADCDETDAIYERAMQRAKSRKP